MSSHTCLRERTYRQMNLAAACSSCLRVDTEEELLRRGRSRLAKHPAVRWRGTLGVNRYHAGPTGGVLPNKCPQQW